METCHVAVKRSQVDERQSVGNQEQNLAVHQRDQAKARLFKKRPPAGACFEGQYLRTEGVQGRLVTGRAYHFEKKKLRKDGFVPFLSFSFFARPFWSATFWGISRLWSQPGRHPGPVPFEHVGYAQSYEKSGPKLCHPLSRSRYLWVLPGVLTAFRPKRKIAPRNLAKDVTTSHPLLLPTPGTTQAPVQPLGAERRGGSGRVCLRLQGRRERIEGL